MVSFHCYSLREGTPIVGWFIIENAIRMDDNWGYPHDLGNHQIMFRVSHHGFSTSVHVMLNVYRRRRKQKQLKNVDPWILVMG